MTGLPRLSPFVNWLSLESLHFDAGEAEVVLDLRAELCNSLAVAHGGVMMTLLDVAMAHAAHSGDAAGRLLVTIEMKTSFMRPATGRLRARGRLLTRTASMAFCEGSAFDAAGTLLAHATGTFKYLRAGPSAPTKPP